jgi:hypothetical protein
MQVPSREKISNSGGNKMSIRRRSGKSIAARLQLPGYAAAVAAFCTAALLLAQPARAGDATFSPVTAITVPGVPLASFDISYDDPYLGLYFLADRSHHSVDVVFSGFGKKHDTLIAQFTDGFAGPFPGNTNAGPNGVFTIGNQLWVADGNSLVKILNAKSGAPIATINTGGTLRADGGCYDPRDQIVLILNDKEPITPQGGAPFDTFISTKKGFPILGRLTMNGTGNAPLATHGIQPCKWSPVTGMFYQNVPEVSGPGTDAAPGETLVINPVTEQIVTSFELPHGLCEGPQWMALGPLNQALIGCNDPLKDVPSTVIINLKNGKILHTIAGEDGADEIWFNPGNNFYFLGINSGATPGRLGVIAAKHGKAQPSATAGSDSGSVAADPISNEVYVPINGGGGTVCSSVGGNDTDGCIAVYEANDGGATD